MVAIVVSMACMMDAAITLKVISQPVQRHSGRWRAGAAALAAGLPPPGEPPDSSPGDLRLPQPLVRRAGLARGDTLRVAANGALGDGVLIGEGRAFLVAGVDFHDRAEPGKQRMVAVGVFDLNANGQALHDLHPVARGVLSRQHGELRAVPGLMLAT